jgi:hypothetical protein
VPEFPMLASKTIWRLNNQLAESSRHLESNAMPRHLGPIWVHFENLGPFWVQILPNTPENPTTRRRTVLSDSTS